MNEIQLAQNQRADLGKKAYQLYDKVPARWNGGHSYLQVLITALPQNPQQKGYTVTYTDLEVEEDIPLVNLLPAPPPSETPPHILQGIALKTTDPRFPTDGDVILTAEQLHNLLTQQQHIPNQKVWATTTEAGFPLEDEEEEIHNQTDDWEGKTTTRFLHPAISNLTKHLNMEEHIGHILTRTQRDVTKLDDDWANPASEPHDTKWHRKWESNPPPPRT